MKAKRVLAMTGGIGAGKSTAARFFSQLGVKIIDTDEITHQLLTEEKNFCALKKRFGEIIVQKGKGVVDRKALRKIVFSDKREKEWLEKRLHPQILKRVRSEIKNGATKYYLVLIPLLVESGWDQLRDWDYLINVDASLKNQMDRIVKREGIKDMGLAQDIIEMQSSRLQKIAQTHYTISNIKDIQHLKKQIEAFFKSQQHRL